ncbi:MAG: hypothetical protein U0I89_00840 [Prevotella sp.]|nr:hypothetical protein [Prevotella sp.]
MNFPLFNFRFSLKHTLPLVLLSCLMACNGNKQKNTDNSAATDTATAADSTLYGICGEGTAMHTLQLITLTGDTLNLSLLPDDDDDADTRATVNGGLMCGDHLAVLATTTADGPIATKVVNLTSLMGRWTSISRNFVIEEGGIVTSDVKAETRPYTSWKIFNGQLLLGRDTFNIVTLGPDSLAIENHNGIYLYKRQLTSRRADK